MKIETIKAKLMGVLIILVMMVVEMSCTLITTTISEFSITGSGLSSILNIKGIYQCRGNSVNALESVDHMIIYLMNDYNSVGSKLK